MLLSITVSNYKSFRKEITLSLEPTLPKTRLSENLFSRGRYTAHTSAVIYGANASGKSNLLSVLSFIKELVLKSAGESQAGAKINTNPFKLSNTSKEPSHFEIIFVVDEIKYRYGFETTIKEITAEWLFMAERIKEYPLFVRENQNIDVMDRFSEGKNLEEKTRPNALFLSVVAQFNGVIASKLISWFRTTNSISGINDESGLMFTIEQLKNPEMKKLAVDWLQSADLSIDDIQVTHFDVTRDGLPDDMPEDLKKMILRSTDKGFSIQTTHKVYDIDNNIIGETNLELGQEESQGTKKFFCLFGPISDTLKNGKILFVDELDARLHPFLTKVIVQWFNSKNNNPNGAQIIFATHDVNLLSRKTYRRDQIWFTEKDRGESTDLYSLAEYIFPDGSGKVRQDASWEKDYIQGRYGAIPFVGNFSKLFKNN